MNSYQRFKVGLFFLLIALIMVATLIEFTITKSEEVYQAEQDGKFKQVASDEFDPFNYRLNSNQEPSVFY
ncbi:MAG: hypothetical protein ACQESP_13080 [Candidatus Muiribacteriota bacterium]